MEWATIAAIAVITGVAILVKRAMGNAPKDALDPEGERADRKGPIDPDGESDRP